MIQKPEKLMLAIMAWGVSIALSVPVFADVPAADRKVADERFKQGRTLLLQGKPAEALPKFEEAQRLDPGEGTLYNIADCYERIGKTASAWSAFVEVVKLTKESKHAEREKLARQRVEALEPKLARLIIQVPVPARYRGLEVRRDNVGVPMSDWGVPIAVDPGSHHIKATSPGYVSWDSFINATASTTEITISPLLRVPLPPPATKPYSAGMRVGGIVLTVIGCMGVTAGAVLIPFTAGVGGIVVGGSHAFLIPGIVLTAVGARTVAVDKAVRSRQPVLVFSPSLTGFKVSF